MYFSKLTLTLGALLLGIVLSGCGGRGLYIYDNRADPYGSPDRPWLVIGAPQAGSQELARKLCQEGELQRILQEARLPFSSQKELWEAACGNHPSAERFLEIYYALSEKSRQRLKRTFRKYGYTLNDYGC